MFTWDLAQLSLDGVCLCVGKLWHSLLDLSLSQCRGFRHDNSEGHEKRLLPSTRGAPA